MGLGKWRAICFARGVHSLFRPHIVGAGAPANMTDTVLDHSNLDAGCSEKFSTLG